nr:SpoIIE family protein phosphatase [Gemmatimonadota bacterium]NIR78096.1 SpoIIE family protein phosphatase [Gemmatimonadota bacterium]NIT86666.1 SpoIIE family protein phosphatase [Gemmatimonadota bacterium]NIU30516.1 SpoIIE family protein phosphatase [Gemmatimonadota bacterium]NIV60886.1 SpoIIE family protein phosphatase [Gemmatimonadota bacterium]
MSPGGAGRPELPDAVRGTLDDFRRALGLDVHLWRAVDGDRRIHLYPEGRAERSSPDPDAVVERITPPVGAPLELEIRDGGSEQARRLARLLHATLERTFEFSEEVRFFTYELSERYEEINLLYSISETLGSILDLDEASRIILEEVCDVLQARRGSLWVYRPDVEHLRLVASVGEEGVEGPLEARDPEAITARVFRDGRPLIGTPRPERPDLHPDVPLGDAESFLSVPIRYTPLTGEPRTVGVINLIGRRRGGRFAASDQKLLSAIASQIGAALENNRLIRESLTQERVRREMELAHDLQMKLLPSSRQVEGLGVGARVQPAESVGGDFYHLLRLGRGRVGVMIGDVSSHGFPAALIMALSMSAATIYAAEFGAPAQVLRHLDEALRDELETTEMYLTLFYGVLDREEGELAYASAGHPHTFVLREAGEWERLEATDPPVGVTAEREGFHQRRVPWNSDEDLLLLFTDGLSDALAAGERRTGEEAILREARRLRDRPPMEIVDA